MSCAVRTRELRARRFASVSCTGDVDDVRGMTVGADVAFEEFVARVTAKFGTAMDGLGLKFTDEDGGRVTLRDDSDYELAIETARGSARGRPEGKLEVWCVDR